MTNTNTNTNTTRMKILEFIKSQGTFETRVREEGDTYKEYCQTGPDSRHLVAMEEDQFLTVLQELRSSGYVERSEKVHSDDTLEYVVTWKLTPEGAALV